LKQDPYLRHIPVIALTGDASAETRTRAFAAGFAEYLVKPTAAGYLRSVMAHYLHDESMESC